MVGMPIGGKISRGIFFNATHAPRTTAVISTMIVSGPGQTNLDLALSKTIAIGWPLEKSSLRIRGEFYNALNHPQFANPDTNFSSSTFGVITSTAVNPRVGQLALIYAF